MLALGLLLTGKLEIQYIYFLNIWNGLLGAFQQPAAEVAITLITPREKYQQVSGLRSFSNSLTSVLTPVLATAFLNFIGLKAVIGFDLLTFMIAFLTLLLAIPIPTIAAIKKERPSLLGELKQGMQYLKRQRGILDLILFLAAVNLIVSFCDNTMPALILSKKANGSLTLGTVNAFAGIASLCGSILVSLMPPAKNRIKIICGTLFFSFATENFFLAFSESVFIWCLATFLGWIVIPFMSANMEVILRTKIPVELQGRVFAARNTLQFFTIPVGYLFSGILIDSVLEPLMKKSAGLLPKLFGEGKGSGAAMLMGILWIAGMLVCLLFSRDKYLWGLEEK